MPSTGTQKHLSSLTDNFMFGEMALKWTANLAGETTSKTLSFFPRSVDLSPLTFY